MAVVTVSGSTGSLKVTLRTEERGTLVALSAGLVVLTVGGVVSVVVPVVKVQE